MKISPTYMRSVPGIPRGQTLYQRALHIYVKICQLLPLSHAHLVCVSVFMFFLYASAWHRKFAQVFSYQYTPRTDYISPNTTCPSHPQKQSLSLRHNKALAYIPSARSSLLLQHMASNARQGCQPAQQTSSLPGPPTDGSVGHVSRGEQKAQTASQQCPGTASAC